MTATITTFQASDQTNAVSQINTLAFAAGDVVVTWQDNNQVFVCRIQPSP